MGSYGGTVKTKKADKGYGFIARRGESDVFFHRSDCAPGVWDQLTEKVSRVTFELADSDRGARAANVELS